MVDVLVLAPATVAVEIRIVVVVSRVSPLEDLLRLLGKHCLMQEPAPSLEAGGAVAVTTVEGLGRIKEAAASAPTLRKAWLPSVSKTRRNLAKAAVLDDMMMTMITTAVAQRQPKAGSEVEVAITTAGLEAEAAARTTTFRPRRMSVFARRWVERSVSSSQGRCFLGVSSGSTVYPFGHQRFLPALGRIKCIH